MTAPANAHPLTLPEVNPFPAVFSPLKANLTEKCRAWPKKQAEQKAKNGPKSAFFNYCRGGTSEKARGWGPFSRKSLSVEQFSCTKSPRCPHFYLFYPTKRGKSPTNRNVWPSLFSIGHFLLLHFFEGFFKKRGGAFRLKSITYPENTPKTTPYISDSPPPPERRACG